MNECELNILVCLHIKRNKKLFILYYLYFAILCIVFYLNDSVMAHVLANGLEMSASSRSPRLSQEYKDNLKTMVELSKKPGVSAWEKQHVEAVDLLTQGLVSTDILHNRLNFACVII